MLVCISVLTLQALMPVGLPAVTEPVQSAHVSHAEIRRVRVPILLEELVEDGCQGIDPGEIEVLEDGQPVGAMHIESKRQRAIHAVLIDTGWDMLDYLQSMRPAAGAYSDSVPADEALLLATADDDLILTSALSSDHRKFKDRLQWIETGTESRFWDSLGQLIRVLRSRPERKVLVVLTDGCDTHRAGGETPADVIELAATTESLIIFPIGLNLPKHCKGQQETPHQQLTRLAQRTGGELFELNAKHQLTSLMQAIRERVEQEKYLTYAPIPFGAGPRDRADQRNSRWRLRKIRFRTDRKCRISIAGPEHRLESGAGSGPVPHAKPFLVRPLKLEPTRGLMQGTIMDSVKDRGPLVVLPPGVHRRTHLTIRNSDDSRMKRRNISAILPPIDLVVRQDARPESSVILALASLEQFDAQRPTVERAGEWEHWSEVPFLVNGHSLLKLRESLALTAAQDPDYLRWAQGRIRTQRLATLDTLVKEAGPDADITTFQTIRKVFEGEDWAPEPRELEQFLAGWLGDLSIMKVMVAVETWLSRRVLETATQGNTITQQESAAKAEKYWQQVQRWFPPPTDVRVMGLLVPGYDPATDIIGYYRVMLRVPDSIQIAASLSDFTASKRLGEEIQDEIEQDDSLYTRFQSLNYSEITPLGIRFIAWILSQDEPAANFVGRFDLRAVRYAHSSDRDLFPVLEAQKLVSYTDGDDNLLARQVTLLLTPRDDPARTVSISAYFAADPALPGGYADHPVCLLFPPQPPTHAPHLALLDALATAQRDAPLPCILSLKR